MIAPPRHDEPHAGARQKPIIGAIVSSNLVRAAADMLAVLAAFAISFHMYVRLVRLDIVERTVPSLTTYLAMAIVIGLISLVTFWYLGSYHERASVLNLWELHSALKGHVLTAAFFFAILFIVNAKFSRIIIGNGLVIALVITVLQRRVFAGAQRSLQVSGELGRRVLIYGCGEAGTLLMKKIVQSPHIGRTVVGFIDDSVPRGGMIDCRITQTDQTVFCAPVLGTLRDLRSLVHQHGVDELFVTTAAADANRFPEILDLAQECGLQVAFVPQLGDIRVDQLHVEDLSAIPVLRPHVVPSRPLYLVTKRAVDVTVASLLLTLTSPIWIAAAIAIRLSGSGSVLFSQSRVGIHGKVFKILKFRTMRHDTPTYAPSPVDDSDPRITSIGRVLRTAGLDELPQLINVIRGDMSLVGPRPEMQFIVDKYTPLERQRLWAKPGITGLWQLSADRVDAIHVNLEYDLHYIRHQSLIFDALILLETLFFTIEVVTKKSVDALRRAFRRQRDPSTVVPLLPTGPRLHSPTPLRAVGDDAVGRISRAHQQTAHSPDRAVPHSALQVRPDFKPPYHHHNAFTSKEQ